MGLFRSLLWIVVIELALSVRRIDGQEPLNTTTIPNNMSEISKTFADSSTFSAHTMLSNSENGESTSEITVITYNVAESENATNLLGNGSEVSSLLASAENEPTSVSCGLGESCDDSKEQFSSEPSLSTTDSLIPTKSNAGTTGNTDVPPSSYEAPNTTRSSKQYATYTTTSIIEIQDLEATTSFNLPSTKNSQKNISFEATNENNFSEAVTPSNQDGKNSLSFTSISSSEFTTSSNAYIFNDSNTPSVEMASNVQTILVDVSNYKENINDSSFTTDEENLTRSNPVRSTSEMITAVNRNTSVSPTTAHTPVYPDVSSSANHSTTSAVNSEMLNSHSTQRSVLASHEESQMIGGKFIPLGFTIVSVYQASTLATAQSDPSPLPNETTDAHRDQTSTNVYIDSRGSPLAQNISDEVNEIAGGTLAKPSQTLVNGKKAPFVNISEAYNEEFTVASTDDDATESSSSVVETITSVIEEMQFSTDLIKSNNLMPHTEDDIQMSKAIPTIPHLLEEGSTGPRAKNNIIEPMSASITERPSINEIKTTLLSTNTDDRSSNIDNLPNSMNATLLSDNQYTDFDDTTRAHISNQLSTLPITTKTSRTVEEQPPPEVEHKASEELVSENISTTSSMLYNSTHLTKPTRMPKILTILRDSVTTTMLLTSITTIQEDLTSHESLSLASVNKTMVFEDLTSTESSIEFARKTTFYAAQNESLRTPEIHCIPLEDLKDFDRKNAITASFTMVIKKSDKEWLSNQTMLFQTWLLKTIIQGASNLSTSWMSGEGKNQWFRSFNVLYIMPTPFVYNNQLVFTFIVKNIFENESIPTGLLAPILTSNANEILNMLNATVSFFAPGLYSDLTILKEGGIFEKFRNEYGVIYIAVSIVFLLMLLLFLAIVSCIKCKKQGSADFQFDKVNLEQHLDLDMGHLNSALANFHDEECKKVSISNGLQMCSVDDNEGWLVPMGQKPIIDLNAPASQDTQM